VARAIVKARAQAAITSTKQLADIVASVVRHKPTDIHPATRTFQALRIYVNDELGQLAQGLSAAERCLKPGGRLVVVTFHSLEDRIVKRFLATRSGKESRGSRHLPEQSIKFEAPSFRIVNPRPLTPLKGELEVNPRARSARLRAAVRTDAPAWPLDESLLGVPSTEN
jgi:16S rRNA (cytosine1402-N4)-methyltransferase